MGKGGLVIGEKDKPLLGKTISCCWGRRQVADMEDDKSLLGKKRRRYEEVRRAGECLELSKGNAAPTEGHGDSA